MKGTERIGSFLLLFQTKPAICRAKSLPAASKTRKQRLCCCFQLANNGTGSFRTSARDTKGLGRAAARRCAPRLCLSSACFHCPASQGGARHSKVSAFCILSLSRTATILPGETLGSRMGPQPDFGAASPRGAVAAARAVVCPDTNPDRAALTGRKRRPFNSQD